MPWTSLFSFHYQQNVIRYALTSKGPYKLQASLALQIIQFPNSAGERYLCISKYNFSIFVVIDCKGRHFMMVSTLIFEYQSLKYLDC